MLRRSIHHFKIAIFLWHCSNFNEMTTPKLKVHLHRGVYFAFSLAAAHESSCNNNAIIRVHWLPRQCLFLTLFWRCSKFTAYWCSTDKNTPLKYGSPSVLLHTRNKQSFCHQVLSSCEENYGHYLHIPEIIITRIWLWYSRTVSAKEGQFLTLRGKERFRMGSRSIPWRVNWNKMHLASQQCFINTMS